MGRGPRNEIISDFITSETLRFESLIANWPKHDAPIEPLNQLFRSTLADVLERTSHQPAFAD